MTTTTQDVNRGMAVRRFQLGWLGRLLLGSQESLLLLSLLLLFLVVGLESERFIATRNMANIFSGNAYIAVAAIGMTMVIVSGNIDISVGSLIGVLATISGEISVYDQFPGWVSSDMVIWLSWLVPMLAGGAIGAVIGFIVAYLRVPSIVTTLGFLSILKGGLIMVTNGKRITDMPDGYELAQMKPLENFTLPGWLPDPNIAFFANFSLEGFLQQLTMPVYFMVGLTILAALWMRYSGTGRAIYAVGGNAEAARLSGISQRRIVMTVFILNGMFAGLASILYATQLSVIQSTVPPNLELLIITAAVVGGVSILGGTGTVVGAMLAAILLNAISRALIFVDISPFWTQAIQGVLILITVLIDLFRRRRQL